MKKDIEFNGQDLVNSVESFAKSLPMRLLKFRIYSFLDNCFHYFNIYDYPQAIAGAVSEPQQFTGIYDRNSNPIYEGDIIRGQFDFGPAGFREQTLPVTWHIERGYQWDYWHLSTIEKIGNIFQHKHLLEK